jgi:hypothetical protein
MQVPQSVYGGPHTADDGAFRRLGHFQDARGARNAAGTAAVGPRDGLDAR